MVWDLESLEWKLSAAGHARSARHSLLHMLLTRGSIFVQCYYLSSVFYFRPKLDKNKGMWKDDHQIRVAFTAMIHIMFLILLPLLYYVASAYKNWNCYSSLVTQVLMDLWKGRRIIICAMNFMTSWMQGHFSNPFHWQGWIARYAPRESPPLNLDYILWDHHRNI